MTMMLAALLWAAAQKPPPPPPPPDPAVTLTNLLESGHQKYLKGDFQAAMADFNRALQIDARNVRALTDRGLCQAGLKQYPKALVDFAKAIEVESRYTPAYVGRADVLAARREYEEAIKDYTKAIEINPVHPTAPPLRGLAWMAKGDYPQALPDFERGIRNLMDAKESPALVLRGASKHWTHDWAGAEADLTRALDQAPRLERALYYRGRNRIFLGKPEEALGDLKRATDLDSKNGEAWLAYGDAYAFQFAYAEAAKAYRHAWDNDSAVDGPAHLRCWRVQMRGGQRETAHKELDAWVKEHKPPLPDGEIRQTAELFLGLGAPEVFLAGIDSGDDRRTLERRCDRHADVGLMRFVAGDFPGAELHFKKAVETGVKDLVSWAFADAQLRKK